MLLANAAHKFWLSGDQLQGILLEKNRSFLIETSAPDEHKDTVDELGREIQQTGHLAVVATPKKWKWFVCRSRKAKRGLRFSNKAGPQMSSCSAHATSVLHNQVSAGPALPSSHYRYYPSLSANFISAGPPFACDAIRDSVASRDDPAHRLAKTTTTRSQAY